MSACARFLTPCACGDYFLRPRCLSPAVHGLWPNFSNGSSPYFCGDEAFAPGQLGSELLGDMAILWGCFWPDCAPPSGQGNLGFWNHEWTKHGTCAIQDSAVMPTQKEFFSSVLRLKRATPLLQILAAVGIVPSNSVTYSALEITNALAGFGYAGLLFCQPPPTTSYGPNVPQLLSIELCFDRELNHMECDTAVQSNALQFGECNEDAIWIPPITYASAT